VLKEVYNKLIIFSAKQVRCVQAIFDKKEANEKAKRVKIDTKKAIIASKKHIKAI
jgi:hypothetical protein